MSCERCEGRWCGAECFAYKQGKADERNRIADVMDAEAEDNVRSLCDRPILWIRSFAERLRKGEV